MSELVKSGSKYTDDQRREAAVLYAVKGTLSAVARDTGIKRTTMVAWKQSDWWDAIVDEVRHENRDRDIARYASLTDKALEAAERGIDELAGDKLSASDIKSLVVAGATTTDKGLLLQGKATSISGKAETIEELKQTFEAMSRRSKAIEDSIVSEQ